MSAVWNKKYAIAREVTKFVWLKYRELAHYYQKNFITTGLIYHLIKIHIKQHRDLNYSLYFWF